VRNYDEDVPANTFRAWTIGLVMTTVCSSLNALFLLRYPNISIGPYVVQLISYPIGVGMAKSLPNKEIGLFGMKFNLNPGPFNVKEHVIIVAMANASFGGGAGYFVSELRVRIQRVKPDPQVKLTRCINTTPILLLNYANCAL